MCGAARGIAHSRSAELTACLHESLSVPPIRWSADPVNETQDAAPKEEGGALARQPPAPTQYELLCVVTAVQERLAESMGVQTVDDLCAVIAKRYPDLLSTPFCATSRTASPDTDDAGVILRSR